MDATYLIAVHEAGHAVVGFAVGLGVDEVTISPADGCNGKYTEGRSTPPRFLPTAYHNKEAAARELQPRMIMSMAGGEAVTLVTGDPDYDVDGCSEDAYWMEYSWNLLRSLYVDVAAAESWARTEARKILEGNWPAVGAMVSALLERKTLRGEEAEQLLEDEGVERGFLPLCLNDYKPPFDCNELTLRQWIRQLREFESELTDERHLTEVRQAISRATERFSKSGTQ